MSATSATRVPAAFSRSNCETEPICARAERNTRTASNDADIRPSLVRLGAQNGPQRRPFRLRNRTNLPARRETLAQRLMTPIFVPLWFGWALKTGHKAGHFALFPGDCRNSQTRWRREMDLNRRDPSFRRYNEHTSERTEGRALDRASVGSGLCNSEVRRITIPY